ncbi:MAG: hypothetical protein OEM02_09465 [Desulfobulbaceae bacterium]|nr:hypothetical protein [Desulfobulbaceae bacterium]
MQKDRDKKIPLYAKVGWFVCWFFMLVLISMIFRNCMSSIKYGNTTEGVEIESYYAKGYSDAVKTGVSRTTEIDELSNPLLKKAYVKGFREGLGFDDPDALINGEEDK